MYSLRRAAARSVRATPFVAIVPKSQSASISRIATRSVGALVARSISSTGIRAFSQTSIFRNDEEKTTPETSSGPRSIAETPYGIFVQNFAYDVTAEDLKEAFTKYGDVSDVFLADTKAFAFVYYGNSESVQQAVDNVDGTFWHGRRLNVKVKNESKRREVNPNRGRTELPPTRTLYIGNIPYDATDADLNTVFSKLTNILDVRVAVDRATGWPRGFAHADFNSLEDSAAAKELLGNVEIRGRYLRATFAEESGKTFKRDSRRKSTAGQDHQGGSEGVDRNA